MHVTYRTTCRVCGSDSLTKVIDLGEQYLQGLFVKPGCQPPPQRQISTSLVRCNPTRDESACGLLQMAVSVPPDILYSTYWYRSGTNQTMREHLQQIVREALATVDHKEHPTVLDIGCNDGTLLSYYPESCCRVGIDPSNAVQAVGAGITVIQDVFPSEELKKQAPEKFDIITSIAMVYDLEQPVEFCKGIKGILSHQGVWIFEMSYMPKMLEMNSYDTICHEHLEYYSLAVLENTLKRADLKIFDATLNDINGGSIRCWATHTDNFRYKNKQALSRLQNLRRQEFDLELDTDKPYSNFQARIDLHRDQLNHLLSTLKANQQTIHIYGASTKGNTILQWCGIDHRLIDYAAERNPDKFGAHTLGTNIPIISEAESRALKPDYYLVLPWHFRQEFLAREHDTLRGGTKMIFPLPEIEIIGI